MVVEDVSRSIWSHRLGGGQERLYETWNPELPRFSASIGLDVLTAILEGVEVMILETWVIESLCRQETLVAAFKSSPGMGIMKL